MKKNIVSLILCSFIALALVGCKGLDSLTNAAPELLAASQITNEELIAYCKEMRVAGDKQANIAGPKNKYTIRINKLLKNHMQEDGLKLNVKVYLTNNVNANATADGSIRVYSGLMDLMTDAELLYVIGHEIGHVANQDSLGAVRAAYIASATRKAGESALATQNKAIAGTLAAAGIDPTELLEAVINAQFSQSQENSADEYAFNFMVKHKYSLEACASALRKLEALSGGASSSIGSSILSSHPGSADRAKRMDALTAKQKK